MKKIKMFAICFVILFMMSDSMIMPKAANYEKSSGVVEDYLQTDKKVAKLHSDAAILMDAKTGEILFQKNYNKKEYPASITKCLTSLVAIENSNLNDVITYSESAIRNIEEGSSSVMLDIGEEVTVDQSLYGAMLESANECCNGLAEHTAGSIEEFTKLMNKKAKELGCVNSHFANANGLYNKDHYTCVYDMATITRAAMQNENWRKYNSTKVFEMPKTNKMKEKRYWRNHHNFVNGDIPYDSTLYTVEGGKTGYTVKCKSTLVTYAKSTTSDMELICVVMRCDDYYYYHGRNVSCVYKDTANLFDYGFSNFQTISSGVEVTDSKEGELNSIQSSYEMLQPEKIITFKPENDCQVTVSNTYDPSNLKGTLNFNPDKKKKKWGTYEFTSAGNVIASTDVYYELNEDFISSFYKSSPVARNVSRIKNILLLIGAICAGLLLLLGFVKMIQAISLKGVFRRRRNSDILNHNIRNSSFKPAKIRRKKQLFRSNDFGYIDSNRRKRRRRGRKNNKLHF